MTKIVAFIDISCYFTDYEDINTVTGAYVQRHFNCVARDELWPQSAHDRLLWIGSWICIYHD